MSSINVQGHLHLGGTPQPPRKGDDPDLDAVEAWWRKQKVAPTRIGEVVRQTFDQVLDAERTGRFDLAELSGVERHYLVTRFRILLRDEFDLPQGPGSTSLSLGVEGRGVEVIFEPGGGWLAPQSAVGELCLLVTADDDESTYSFGIVRPQAETVEQLSESSAAYLDKSLPQVRWVWRNEKMPVNILKTLPAVDVQAIFAQSGKGHGQARIDELCRRVHGKIIPRRLTTTVAHQADPMKRPRTSRDNLQPEGILILGHQNDHPQICGALGLPIPTKGELVAVRVVRATLERQKGGRPFATIAGSPWVVALGTEPIEAGPEDY